MNVTEINCKATATATTKYIVYKFYYRLNYLSIFFYNLKQRKIIHTMVYKYFKTKKKMQTNIQIKMIESKKTNNCIRNNEQSDAAECFSVVWAASKEKWSFEIDPEIG